MIFDNSWPLPADKESCRCDIVQAKIMIETITRLESEKENLVNRVSDLRQLLQRIAVQQEKEAKRHKGQTEEFQNEIQRLQKALNASETHSPFFHSVSQYWQEFLE